MLCLPDSRTWCFTGPSSLPPHEAVEADNQSGHLTNQPCLPQVAEADKEKDKQLERERHRERERAQVLKAQVAARGGM